jgi:hypothetical protein
VPPGSRLSLEGHSVDGTFSFGLFGQVSIAHGITWSELPVPVGVEPAVRSIAAVGSGDSDVELPLIGLLDPLLDDLVDLLLRDGLRSPPPRLGVLCFVAVVQSELDRAHHHVEARRRLAEHDADPSTAIPWDEAEMKLRAKK